MNKLAHLQMLQTVIARMASNSFMLKGWSVTLVAALFAVAADKAKVSFVALAYFPALVFWFLDGYFLRQERLFRALYDQARSLAEANITFSMDTTAVAQGVSSWAAACISRTLWLFHGTVVASIAVVMWCLSLPHA